MAAAQPSRIGILQLVKGCNLMRKADSMILLQIHFNFDKNMSGNRLAENGKPLAESLNLEEGFISKIWIENQETGVAGGIHLFDNAENARSFAEKQSERLSSIGAANINIQYFEVNQSLSMINKGI